MSKNSEYAAKLIERVQRAPSIAVTAAAKIAYRTVLENTVQDSGEAAFNWRAQINTTRQYPYMYRRGMSPVGFSGDKRSSGFERDIVIDFRLSDFISRLQGKKVKMVLIYNPIDDYRHALNAELAAAQGIATGQDWLNEVAEAAVNAYL